jgi:hypothetical protein
MPKMRQHRNKSRIPKRNHIACLRHMQRHQRQKLVLKTPATKTTGALCFFLVAFLFGGFLKTLLYGNLRAFLGVKG